MSTQNGIEVKEMSGQGVPTQKDMELTAVTVEIKTLQRQAQQMVLTYAIEIGRRLTEAKALVEYGGWGTYIKETLGYSQSTANNFMRLFEEYGKSQQSLFGGEADSQTFGNLTYTQALALLALPAEEREEFVQANDVEGMSTRELEQAIKERDEAREALQEEKEMSAAMEEQARAADEIAQKAADRAKRLEQELEELKARPIDVAVETADPEEVKKAVDAAVTAEREKAKGERAKLEAQLKEAEAKAGDNAASASAEVEELRRKLAMADPITAEFKGLFAQAGQLVGRMLELVDQAPEDKRPNLTAALEALAGQMTATEEG